MKKCIVILFLAAQIVILFSKVITVAHFHWHREEIAEHFCHHQTEQQEEDCAGACYLSAQLDHDHEENSASSFKNLVQKETVFFEKITLSVALPIYFTIKKSNNFPVKSPHSSSSHLSVWRPPSPLV